MGRNRKTMKFVLALLFVAAVSAHWTHDDSLAREIGPPPGEEDVEVANLGESAGAVKQYRITFGTQVVGGKLGASQSQFKVALKGAKPKAPAAGQAIAWTQDTTWKEHADNVIKYYQGVHLTYALAKTTAPELHPGMSPLVDTLQAGCSNLKNGKMKPCDAATAKTLNACEPGAKACKNAIGQAMVAYAYGKTHQLINGINFHQQGGEGPRHGPHPAWPVPDGGCWQDHRREDLRGPRVHPLRPLLLQGFRVQEGLLLQPLAPGLCEDLH